MLAPIFVAAGNYLLIGRLIRAVLPPTHHKIFRVPARLLTRIYVTFDIVCLCVQSSGSSLASSVGWTGNLSDIGINILLAGLSLQVLAFSTYLCILVRFHLLSRSMAVSGAPEGWFKVLKAVYISSFLILVRTIWVPPPFLFLLKRALNTSLYRFAYRIFSWQVRCIFRMVEFAEGPEGYSLQHEWMFWVFEALLMIVALTIFCIWHPTKYLGNAGMSEKRRSREGEAEAPRTDQ